MNTSWQYDVLSAITFLAGFQLENYNWKTSVLTSFILGSLKDKLFTWLVGAFCCEDHFWANQLSSQLNSLLHKYIILENRIEANSSAPYNISNQAPTATRALWGKQLIGLLITGSLKTSNSSYQMTSLTNIPWKRCHWVGRELGSDSANTCVCA